MSGQSRLKVVSAPTELPLSLGELKSFIGFDADQDEHDPLIMSLQRAAVDMAERWLDRALLTQTLRYTMDRWPSRNVLDYDWEGWKIGADIVVGRNHFELPRPPLQGVTSFVYFDSGDNQVDVPADTYFVDTESEPGRIGLRYGKTWPSATLRPHNAVQLIYTAGYGATWNDVPQDVRHGIRLLTAWFYEHRAECEAGDAVPMPTGVGVTLQRYRVVNV